MINIEELKAVRTIVTHKDCADGVASALILHDVLPEAAILFMQYGTPELAALEATPGMLWCDFSPPADRAAEFVHAKSIVLDHHRTAKPVVEAFGSRGIFADEQIDPGVSGAVLAFRRVWQPLVENGVESTCTGWRSVAELAGVRDTWQKDSPLWREACAQAEALRFLPFADLRDAAEAEVLSELLKIGPVLLEKHAERVTEAVRTAHRFTTLRGIRVVVFQGVSETSDAADLLGAEADLVMGFKYLDDGGPRVVWSCRSRGDFDVAAFAKMYGGGGHAKAAGFWTPALPHDPNPFTEARAVVAAFENTR
jgi:hypothetical protein